MHRVGEKDCKEEIEGSPATHISRVVISGAYAGEDKEDQSSSIGLSSLAPELAAADTDPDVPTAAAPCGLAVA